MGQTGVADESGLLLFEQDLNAAERNVRGALEIVPYWHYVRDILLPQVLAAKAKAK